MIYPKFLQKGQTIGITAPSSGILKKKESYDYSIAQLNNHGFLCKETSNVYTSGVVSSNGKQRADEFMELLKNPEVQVIFCATGGDFLMEMLPYLEYEEIRKYPKWIQGYSDPTGLLHSILVNCEIATLYGANAGGFDMNPWHQSLVDNIGILTGEDRIQSSFPRYQAGWKEDNQTFDLDTVTEWKTPHGNVDIIGRMMGGCLDCLWNLIGTSMDKTAEFVEKYGEDGFVWYFDIFSLTAEDTYRALWQMKQAGWFVHVKGIILGRVRFPNTMIDMTYQEAIERLFSDIPLILEADIGHVKPSMTIMNGAIGHVKASSGKGQIELFRKE